MHRLLCVPIVVFDGWKINWENSNKNQKKWKFSFYVRRNHYVKRFVYICVWLVECWNVQWLWLCMLYNMKILRNKLETSRLRPYDVLYVPCSIHFYSLFVYECICVELFKTSPWRSSFVWNFGEKLFVPKKLFFSLPFTIHQMQTTKSIVSIRYNICVVYVDR